MITEMGVSSLSLALWRAGNTAPWIGIDIEIGDWERDLFRGMLAPTTHWPIGAEPA